MHTIATYTTILASTASFSANAWVAPAKTQKQAEGNEEWPDYEVLECEACQDGYELRRYSPSVWTTAIGSSAMWSGSGAFQQLFKYISGENDRNMKIAMTAPVLSVSNSQQERQWFFMPKKLHSNPPIPTGYGVENVMWAPLDVYVIKYTPSVNMMAMKRLAKQHEEKLVTLMEKDGLILNSNFIGMSAGYNGPWSTIHKNEVWITADQVITKEDQDNYTEPENSWPALELDSDVENDGIEVSVLAQPSNMTIYHVQPEHPSDKAIIVNHDSIGINSGRNRAICDQLSRDTGYHVLMPDFFRNGDGVLNYGGFTAYGMTPEGFAWFSQMTSERVLSDTELVFDYMKNAGFEIESYGSTGYCFGGWVGFHQATTGKISAHVSAHPSLQAEEFKGFGLETLVKAVKSPVLILPAGTDPDNVKEGGDVEQWLEFVGKKVEVFEFPEMRHGWVPRGNVSIPEVERDVKLAMEKTVEFLMVNM